MQYKILVKKMYRSFLFQLDMTNYVLGCYRFVIRELKNLCGVCQTSFHKCFVFRVFCIPRNEMIAHQLLLQEWCGINFNENSSTMMTLLLHPYHELLISHFWKIIRIRQTGALQFEQKVYLWTRLKDHKSCLLIQMQWRRKIFL